MNYFIDFEATQFSNEIISVGCVNEKGDTFSSLVKPKKKLTTFITELTGITQEMVDNAPSSDEVFTSMYNWMDKDEEPHFFCYGNTDITFVKKNLSKTSNFKASCMLSMIGMNLINYAGEVKAHFGLISPIGLIKIVSHYRGYEVEQAHDALEDALFLKEVYDNVSHEVPDFETEDFSPWRPKPTMTITQAPVKNITLTAPEPETLAIPSYVPAEDRFRRPTINGKLEVDGPECLQYIGHIAIVTKKKGIKHEFTNMISAVQFLKKSVVSSNAIDENIAKKIKKAINDNTQYCNFTWKAL